MERVYSKYAPYYNVFLYLFPIWKIWLKKVILYIKGPKILEISFGSGYLMSKYAGNNDVCGVDLSAGMVRTAKHYLDKRGVPADLVQANAESLPYRDGSFDTVINTMAFTGYPDGGKVLSEIRRVLKPRGVLLLMDFDFPDDRNLLGYLLAKIMERGGDILKDIRSSLTDNGFAVRERRVGGFGSVKLYICRR